MALLLSVFIAILSHAIVLCDVWPHGTYFIWHVLKGIMLGWMIHVYTRHMLATGRTGR